MHTAFIVSRELFNHPIMKNIVDFRLFLLIFGKANHSKDKKEVANGILLERGQWLRSTRKLQDDLEYIENRQLKKYSTSVINNAVKRLCKLHMICCETTELGTLFTVVNYNRYQDLSNYKNGYLEHNLEQCENSVRTELEQSENNINNVINEKNVINDNNKELTVVANAKPKNDDKHKERDINFLIEYVRNNYNGFSDDFFAVYESYLYVRKKKKATMSINAIDYTIKQLKKKYDSTEVIISALEYCIETGYTGFFYKAENEKKQTYKNTQQRNDDLLTLELEKEMKKINGTSIRIENT